MIETLIKIVLCHVVGDYLFQTDYMAREKGKDWYILFVHCACYCVPFVLVFGIGARLAVIFLTHIVVDAMKARYGMIDIITDQVIHYGVALICAFM